VTLQQHTALISLFAHHAHQKLHQKAFPFIHVINHQRVWEIKKRLKKANSKLKVMIKVLNVWQNP